MKHIEEASTSPTRTSGADLVEGGTSVPSGIFSLQWWPALAGVGFAAFVAFDLFSGEEHGGELAPIVAASGLVYLAAAALERPSASWLVFFGSVVVITAGKMGFGVDATWYLLGIAAAFLGYGIVRGTHRSAGGLPLQTVAMIAFGAIAAIALYANQTAGAYLVAAGLFAHAAWDVYHHRMNKVVSRSMAEFCCVLDIMLAVAIVMATASS